MLNQVIIVGRLVKTPEYEEGSNKPLKITVACPRSFKNENGEYDTDFIDVILWNMVAKNTSEYCRKGDIIGIKGRIQSSSYENEEGNKVYKQEVVAEKVTFLSSKSSKDEEETD